MKCCQDCNKEFADDAVFCPHCGNGLVNKAQEYVCPNCGHNLGTSVEQYCPNCGQQFYAEQTCCPENKNSSVKYIIIAAVVIILIILFVGNQMTSTSIDTANKHSNAPTKIDEMKELLGEPERKIVKDHQFNPFLAPDKKLGVRKKNVASAEYFPKNPIDRIAKAQAEKIATDYFGVEQKLFYVFHSHHDGPPKSMYYMYALPNTVKYENPDKMRYWMICIGMDPVADSHKIAVLDCYLANGQTNELKVMAERVIFPGRPVYDNKERVGETCRLFKQDKDDRLNEFLVTDWKSEK